MSSGLPGNPLIGGIAPEDAVAAGAGFAAGVPAGGQGETVSGSPVGGHAPGSRVLRPPVEGEAGAAGGCCPDHPVVVTVATLGWVP